MHNKRVRCCYKCFMPWDSVSITIKPRPEMKPYEVDSCKHCGCLVQAIFPK